MVDATFWLQQIQTAGATKTPVAYATWYSANVTAHELIDAAYATDDAATLDAYLRLNLTSRDRAALLTAAPRRPGHWATECMHLLHCTPLNPRDIYLAVRSFISMPDAGGPVPVFGQSHRTPEDGAMFLDALYRIYPVEHAAVVDVCSVIAVDSIVYEEQEETERWARLLKHEIARDDTCNIVSRDANMLKRSTMMRIHQIVKIGENKGLSVPSVVYELPLELPKSGVIPIPSSVLETLDLSDMPACCKPESSLTGMMHTRSRALVACIELTNDDGVVRRVLARHVFVESLMKLFLAKKPVRFRYLHAAVCVCLLIVHACLDFSNSVASALVSAGVALEVRKDADKVVCKFDYSIFGTDGKPEYRIGRTGM